MRKLDSTIAAKVVFLMLCLTSCSVGPEKIEVGKDACSFCRMSIADNRFGGEILTKKGKVYKFDDTHCMLGFIKANTIDKDNIKETYFVNFEEPHDLIQAGRVILLKSKALHSPMGGNIAGFSDQNRLKKAIHKFNGEEQSWNTLLEVK